MKDRLEVLAESYEVFVETGLSNSRDNSRFIKLTCFKSAFKFFRYILSKRNILSRTLFGLISTFESNFANYLIDLKKSF